MDPETKVALDNIAKLINQGENKSAQVLLGKLILSQPDLEQAWFLLSFAVQEQDRKIYSLQRALRINPSFSEAQSRLASLEKPVPKPTVPPPPKKAETNNLLENVQTCLDAGDPESAQRILRDLLSVNQEHKQAWYLMSFTMPTVREQTNALRQAIRIDPNYEDAKIRLQTLQKPVEKIEPLPEPATRPDVTSSAPLVVPKPNRMETVSRIAKYTAYKGVILFFTVAVGVYITILIANLGGHIDEIFRGEIASSIMGMALAGDFDDMSQEEKDATIAQIEWQMEEEMGLHKPFLLRTFGFLVNGLTLNLGEAYMSAFFRGVFQGANRSVQVTVLERLPFTILLVGVSNFLFFFVSVFVALFLSRNYGGIMDRISVLLAALMSAPSWIYGIVLIILLAGQLQILPFPKTIDLEFVELTPEFIRLVLSQMVMPVMAIFLSLIFTGVFAWRTFFLIYSGEDYVDMAKAQGLSNRVIERRYILKPSMPYVITSFAMMMITLWEGSIALEVLFRWPGIGSLFYQAVSHFNPTSTQLVVAVVVVFAYLLAITVFLLDIVYALIDPRVRVQSSRQRLSSAGGKRKRFFRFRRKPKDEKNPKTGEEYSQTKRGKIKVTRLSLSQRLRNLWKPGGGIRSTFREVVKFPSALVGLIIILTLIGISIYTIFAIPYEQAIALWQTHNPDELGRTTWYQNPHNARPLYINLFRSQKLPETIIRDSRDESIEKTIESAGESATDINYSFVFDYPYSDFPVEMVIFFESVFEEKAPHISMTWFTPDNREIRLGSFSPERAHRYAIDQDGRLERKMRGVPIIPGLLGDPEQEYAVPLNGKYELKISSLVFEPEGDVDAEMIIYGQVAGLAGTDDKRRDLMVALLWGAPVALAFGFMGAIVTSLISMLIAAIGVWHGGWADELIQRITDVNIILPTLPVAIMVFVMYSKSIWAILGVIVLLNIFGTAIKNYRSVFLQVKEAGYIEGAQAYGASDWRIIMRYLIPRIIPVLIPQLVIMVPGFVFYEATLAYLGLSDPQLPTWGKVIHDAVTNGLYQDQYYWVLQPVGLLVLTGLAFALFGFALDRVINPRLRDV